MKDDLETLVKRILRHHFPDQWEDIYSTAYIKAVDALARKPRHPNAYISRVVIREGYYYLKKQAKQDDAARLATIPPPRTAAHAAICVKLPQDLINKIHVLSGNLTRSEYIRNLIESGVSAQLAKRIGDACDG